MLEQGPSADLVEAFGLAVPSLVICKLLGVPYADREFFQSGPARWSRLQRRPPGLHGRGHGDRDYLDGLIAEAEQEPGDDLSGGS